MWGHYFTLILLPKNLLMLTTKLKQNYQKLTQPLLEKFGEKRVIISNLGPLWPLRLNLRNLWMILIAITSLPHWGNLNHANFFLREIVKFQNQRISKKSSIKEWMIKSCIFSIFLNEICKLHYEQWQMPVSKNA